MIIFHDTLNNFKKSVELNLLADQICNKLQKHGFGINSNEFMSWNNSMLFMNNVLDDKDFDGECLVAIEYNIPQTGKRVDFMILGNNGNKDHIVIIELKQWSKVEKIDNIQDHSIRANLKSNPIVAHPSYQAYSYKCLISDYYDDAKGGKTLKPCAYLHNLSEHYRTIIEDDIYSKWIKEAPVFLKTDVVKIRNFIKQYIHLKAIDGSLLYKIDEGRFKPTKSLQNALDSMLCGNKEFHMIDEQVVAYDKIMKAIIDSQNDNKKHVMIITGGPGTGKSVLAINLLAKCIIDLKLNASYITKNMAPRNCYKSLLSKGDAKKEINLQIVIQTPNRLPYIVNNGLDVGIFDEAHRLQKKPWLYKSNDMLEDAINASKVSIFFIDEDQRITTKDIYNANTIIQYAKKQNAVFHGIYNLISQFRCNGSNGYIAFIDNLLQIKETTNKVFDINDYDFRVFDDPNEMYKKMQDLVNKGKKARMVAGYCYDWNVKYKRSDWDICLKNNFYAKWNLMDDKIWAINKNSFKEVGCVHTCQGMEFDYVGVIIGKDLTYRNGKIITNQDAISKDDKTSGIRRCKDKVLANKLIKNTYKVLLTRGLKGCYVFCEDEELSQYIKKSIISKNITCDIKNKKF